MAVFAGALLEKQMVVICPNLVGLLLEQDFSPEKFLKSEPRDACWPVVIFVYSMGIEVKSSQASYCF